MDYAKVYQCAKDLKTALMMLSQVLKDADQGPADKLKTEIAEIARELKALI
jgi:hypothetical protein